MLWDHTLLRKFSCTSHFRLLNQVRNELKSQPLNREVGSQRLQVQSKPLNGMSSRQRNRPNAMDRNDTKENQNAISDYDADSTKSSLDRLVDVQLR